MGFRFVKQRKYLVRQNRFDGSWRGRMIGEETNALSAAYKSSRRRCDAGMTLQGASGNKGKKNMSVKILDVATVERELKIASWALGRDRMFPTFIILRYRGGRRMNRRSCLWERSYI